LTQPASPSGSTRRDFLAGSAATLAGAALLAPHAHAAGGDTLRVGLIGCGGRGTGAAENALMADPNVKLVALADVFPDRIERSLKDLYTEAGKEKKASLAKKIDVKPDHKFTGFDAYKQLLASDVDVVLLTTPPHFRPAHLKAAVEAGKHVFCEKPVAVDAPGVRSVLDSCREAKKKNLSVVSGLCWRYHHAKRETMQRVHDGYVGDIVALHCTYNAGLLWSFVREPGWSDMEYQMRNWLYYTWLSGDHIVEQAIHSIDKMAWAMKDEPPLRAEGSGGRQVRTDPLYGHIFDHHAVVYEYKNGVKMFHFCRQQGGHCHNGVTDFVMGTEGTCAVSKHTITGKRPWAYKEDKKKADDMYQNEHDELFAGIRSGHPINNGEYMSRSTLLAIMGRMATYTGKVVTWEQALNSKEVLNPPMKEGFDGTYKFGPMNVPEVAMPGITDVV
jgi:predicted dehydrogenase